VPVNELLITLMNFEYVIKRFTSKVTIKDEIKLSLCLIKHYAMKTYGGVILDLGTRWR
jgi:hypothetical protein